MRLRQALAAGCEWLAFRLLRLAVWLRGVPPVAPVAVPVAAPLPAPPLVASMPVRLDQARRRVAALRGRE